MSSTAAKHQAAKAIDPEATEAHKAILVVDDDEKLLANLETFFSDNGFRPICVLDIQQALDAVTNNQVDVAVVDYILGGESGLSLVQELRQRRATLPIVLMSGHLNDWVESLARSFGPICYLEKPFSDAQILDAIDESRRLFEGSQS